MKPRVIWLDDDIHAANLRGTVALFRKHFDIIECENIEEFRHNSKAYEWDAAILDVLNAEEKITDILNSLRLIGGDKLWFVFSGKPQITKDDGNTVMDLLKGPDYSRSYSPRPIYEKSTHDDELIIDIENAVKNQRFWQVENEYEEVLKIADKYLEDKSCRKHLLEILCAASGATSIDTHLYYNRIRVILEWIFRAANKIGLLHDKCFDDHKRINLTDASCFMSGLPANQAKVKCKKSHFPYLIAQNVRNILLITGGASHTTVVEEKDIMNLTLYWKDINTPYLLYSLTFMLCDILVWFDKYATENSNVDKNKSLWEDVCENDKNQSKKSTFKNLEGTEGFVEVDSKGNYHIGSCLLPYRSGIPAGTKIKIIKVGDNTNPNSKVLYPGFVVKYEEQ